MLATIVAYSGMSVISRGLPTDLWLLLGLKDDTSKPYVWKNLYKNEKVSWAEKKIWSTKLEKSFKDDPVIEHVKHLLSKNTKFQLKYNSCFDLDRSGNGLVLVPTPKFDGGAPHLHASNLKPLPTKKMPRPWSPVVLTATLNGPCRWKAFWRIGRWITRNDDWMKHKQWNISS